MSSVRAHRHAAPVRIACVQHGDYLSALPVLDHDEPEPYFGMRESVRSLEQLFAGRDALVVSLDTQKAYDRRLGDERLLGLPMPGWCRRVPVLRYRVHTQQVMRMLREFRPTHMLLRTGGKLGLSIAEYCVRERIPTLVILANAVWAPDTHGAWVSKKLMRKLCDPTFVRVYNYKPTACMSMVDYGLTPGKCLPYEFDGERQPDSYPEKTLGSRDDCHLVFAARMIESKGPLDVVEAVARLRQRGIPARATLFGDGPRLARVREAAQALPSGAVATPGWVDNPRLFATFRGAQFVCVPSHPTFVEGMPMALTEALASRTPVLASNCPVFARSFSDGEGVRLFKAANAQHLADVVSEVWNDPAQYARLSASTLAAFERVSAHRSFGEVLLEWQREIERGGAFAEPSELEARMHSPRSA